MRELLVRGKNTIDPDVIDPGGRSVEISPVKRDFTFYLLQCSEKTDVLSAGSRVCGQHAGCVTCQ
jgi:hypothetical protein